MARKSPGNTGAHMQRAFVVSKQSLRVIRVSAMSIDKDALEEAQKAKRAGD